MSLQNALGNLALDATLQNRYGGGKTSATATVSASGNTTLHTPASGKRVTLYWVSAIPDPQATTNPVITISLGGTPVYVGYAVSHWEPFTGPIDGQLVINLSSGGTQVAVTAHYIEV